MRLVARIDELERRHGCSPERQVEIEKAAAEFFERMGRLRAGLTEADRLASPAQRAKWSKAQEVAWTMRFDPMRMPALIDEMKEMVGWR